MAVKQSKLNTRLKRAILQEDTEDARAALLAGADPNHVMSEDQVRTTPLIQAATKNLELVNLLLDAGADALSTDWLGGTALHFARDPFVVQALLAAGGNPNAKAHNGDAPLHACVSAEKTRLLLDAGADPLMRNTAGELPWQCLDAWLSRIDPDEIIRNAQMQSCREASLMLRALAEGSVLENATQSVQMTPAEEAEEAQTGRF